MAVDRIEIDTPRVRFGARAAGEPHDPLVLCLHGFPDDASTFDALLERLAARGLRAVAPYCRGYAPSPLTNPDGSAFGKDLFDVLSRDCLAVADALAPGAGFRVVGHDNGAFTVYHLLRLAPDRIMRAVTMTAAHPAAVFSNTARSPRQMWRSRYAVFFQLPGVSEWYVRKDDFAYIEELWRRWAAPGWALPRAHVAEVKRTLAASGLASILHYRSGGINAGGEWSPTGTPTLYLAGEKDGCVLPEMGKGQERYFAGEFKSEVVAGAGHFLHLEQSDLVGHKVVAWLTDQAN